MHAVPGQGVTSMFNFGQNYGFLKGVLFANSVPICVVSPQRWKKALNVTSDKNTSVDKAKELFPGVNLKATPRCKKDSDGKAESLLLAYYLDNFKEEADNKQMKKKRGKK